ncbi:unnamed protein product, partial [Hymenolepis diminuta]
TPSPDDLNKLLWDLRNGDNEIRLRALNEIEKLQLEDLTGHQDYFIWKLLEIFKQYRTNTNSCIRVGHCIVRHLIYQQNIDFHEERETFLEILGLKLAKARLNFTEIYLKIAMDTIPKVKKLLSNSSFIYFLLIFLHRNYLYFHKTVKMQAMFVFTIAVTLTREQYINIFNDSLPVALQLIHLKSESLQDAVFYLLEIMYARISASADKHFLDCNKETVSILLKALSDYCAQLYDQALDENMLIPVLTTLPISWFSRPKIDEKVVAATEAQAEEAVIILKYLHLISQSNAEATEWLLTLQFNLTAVIAVLLFYGKDEVTQGCVLCLLDSIISNIKKPESTAELYESGIFALKCHRLFNNIAFIEALVLGDTVKLGRIASECSADIEDDYRNRRPTQW